MARKVWRTPQMLYGLIGGLLLSILCFDIALNVSVFFASTDVMPSGQSASFGSGFHRVEVVRQQRHLQDENVNGFTEGISTKEEGEEGRSQGSSSSGPPSYLPLAQHLKNVNFTKKGSSLQDMVFGAQKRTYPDLEPTNNFDLLNCAQCSKNCKALQGSVPQADHQFQLACLAIRLVTFYNLSSMLVLPCTDEIHWILPFSEATRKLRLHFKTYCAVSSDKMVVDLMKRHDRNVLTGLHFVVYQPMYHGSIPKVDLMFTWRGLEQYDLDAIHEVFKEAVKSEIKYMLVGNSPGYANAKMVETGTGTFSIKRPGVPGLNVRAYPFGFKQASRVFSLVGKQLLFYNTSRMRDGW